VEDYTQDEHGVLSERTRVYASKEAADKDGHQV